MQATLTVSAEPPPSPRNEDWRHQAACRDADPRLFDYDPETDADSTAEPARRICADCRVRAACLSYALSRPNESDCVGIYGGLTPAERSERRAQLELPSPTGRRSWRPAVDATFARVSFDLSAQIGVEQAAEALGVTTTPRGWTRRLMADRELAKAAFELARQQSILAAASTFQVSAPTLRRAFVHHGLGHPHAGLDQAELRRRWNVQAKDAPDHHIRKQRRAYRARLAAKRHAV